MQLLRSRGGNGGGTLWGRPAFASAPSQHVTVLVTQGSTPQFLSSFLAWQSFIKIGQSRKPIADLRGEPQLQRLQRAGREFLPSTSLSNWHLEHPGRDLFAVQNHTNSLFLMNNSAFKLRVPGCKVPVSPWKFVANWSQRPIRIPWIVCCRITSRHCLDYVHPSDKLKVRNTRMCYVNCTGCCNQFIKVSKAL